MLENKDLWLRHLSASLKANGQAAYLWQVDDDLFEFAGDVEGLFGLNEAAMPSGRDGIYGLINPRDVVERKFVLNRLIGDCEDKSLDFILNYRIRRSDGQQLAVIETGSVQKDSLTGKKSIQSVICIDEQAQLASAAQAGNQNVSFALMPNASRKSLQFQLEAYLDQRQGGLPRGYFLAVGIDHLSMINEAYGMQSGDELLNQTELRLKQLTNGNAIVTRIHSDLFGVFFKNGAQAEMYETAYGILKGIYSKGFIINERLINNMVSIGGVSFDTPNLKACTIQIHAEQALREAKNRGRGCFVAYNDGMRSDVHAFKDDLAIGDQFLKGFRDGRVHLAYQKIISTSTNDASFYECLIRLIDEDGKMIPAGHFIEAVERMGMTRIVDHFSTRRAIQELRIFPELVLSINVSNHSLTDPQWLHEIQNDLRRSPDVAKRLIVEITESAAMNDIHQTIRVIKTLRDLGCQIALDDFGAGQTAFTHMRDLKLDMVKIDKSFVRNMGEKDNMLFINVLQSLAGALDIETVGEGAETLAEAEILARGGINHIQGYAYSVPSIDRIWLPQENEFRVFDRKYN